MEGQPREALSRSRLVVKNTFIDIVDDQSAEPEEWSTRLRTRASSDPSLFETSKQEALREKFDRALEEEGKEADLELQGMSDTDAQTEDEGVADRPRRLVAPLPCYSHIAEEPAVDEPARGSAACPPARGSAACPPAPSDEAAASSSAHSSQVDIERLISENARLARENELLRSQCAGSSLAGCAARAQEQQAPRQAGSLPAAASNALWVPVGFVMETQAQCQARLAAEGLASAGCEAAGPSSWRQSRRSAAQRAVPEGRRPSFAEQGTTGAATAEADPGSRTTVMLRNLPNNYTRAMVMSLLDSEGFARKYDFLYLPIDFKSRACLGYAFVNLVDPADVPRFWSRFSGFSQWLLPSRKVCHVSWSGPHQGLESHVERYRNSPVMHKSVPDEYKPVVFRDGVRVAFPPPTKSPRAPRIRHMSEFRATAGRSPDS